MPEPVSAIDFNALGQAIIGALIAGVERLASPLPATFEEWLLSAMQSILSAQGAKNLLTHVPTEWTTANADVLYLWRQGLPVQIGLMALVIAIQGYRVVQGNVDVWQAVMRTTFLAAVGQSVPLWLGSIIGAVNVAADSVGSAPLPTTNSLPNDIVLGAMLIIATVLAVLAWVKGMVGVVFVMILIVAAPYLLILSALPLLEGIGKWWASELIIWLLRPFMVALVLRLGLGIGVVDNPATRGMPFLFAIVAFWVAFTMDSHIRKFSVGAWGSMSNFGLFARGARLAAGAFGGGAAAPAAAAASATP